MVKGGEEAIVEKEKSVFLWHFARLFVLLRLKMDDRHFLQRIPWQVILLAFAVLFLLRNMMTSLAGDDYSYAFIWDGEHWGNLMDGIGERQRVECIGDILTSQWSHYFTWGGRTPSMFFIQLFVWMGKGWFDIANTLAYVLLMLLMYWMAAGRIVSPARHKSYKVTHALYLDMGSGWNYAWYRDVGNQVKEIFPESKLAPSFRYRTNWITFYK